jgi:hypothetical protein
VGELLGGDGEPDQAGEDDDVGRAEERGDDLEDGLLDDVRGLRRKRRRVQDGVRVDGAHGGGGGEGGFGEELCVVYPVVEGLRRRDGGRKEVEESSEDCRREGGGAGEGGSSPATTAEGVPPVWYCAEGWGALVWHCCCWADGLGWVDVIADGRDGDCLG